MPAQPILVIRPPCAEPEEEARLSRLLEQALDGFPCEITALADSPGALHGRRILFAVALGESGINLAHCEMLRFLRTHPDCLEGCVGGILVDGGSELFTKSVGRELVFSANRAGCAFVGRPLVEGTVSLANFSTLAKLTETDCPGAYLHALRELIARIQTFSPPRSVRPNILALHASSHETSNTLALWQRVRERLPGCDIAEICLRNGTISDCSGCPYTMCLHFGERGECFYGGVMVQEVYPAILQANALVMLCPNYNDALSANLTACINRLTALFRTMSFYDKALFGIVVSGYSGSDIVASQLISALCINKTFYLPARFAMLETANDANSALRLPGIENRIDAFAQNILFTLCPS